MIRKVFYIFVLMLSNDATASSVVEIYTQAKQQMTDAEIKERKILAELYDSNEKIKTNLKEKNRINEENEALKINIGKKSQEILDLKIQIAEEKKKIIKRLKAVYQLGGANMVRIVFGSVGGAQLERQLKILNILSKRDRDLIAQHELNIKNYSQKRNHLNKRIDYLKKVEIRLANQEKQLVIQVQHKNKILNDIKTMLDKSGQDLVQIKKNMTKESLEMLEVLSGKYFLDQQGALPSPVNGKLEFDFGIHHNVEGYVLKNKGLFLSAIEVQQIQSIFDGKVAFVGPVDGYGQTVVVDHGDHYFSIYSSVANLKVKMGDTITQYQPIAETGIAPVFNKNGLYFEIRHFSEPEDPKLWVKGIN